VVGIAPKPTHKRQVSTTTYKKKEQQEKNSVVVVVLGSNSHYTQSTRIFLHWVFLGGKEGGGCGPKGRVGEVWK
jgi:hypothetical protein